MLCPWPDQPSRLAHPAVPEPVSTRPSSPRRCARFTRSATRTPPSTASPPRRHRQDDGVPPLAVQGALITACLVDAFGPAPLDGADREEILSAAIRWIAAKIGEPGIGAAFAGVFTDAVNDPALRRILATQLQDPYRLALQDTLGEPEQRVLFLIDVVVGTLLHRLGMTGEPMVDADVDALVAMVLRS
ncbi:TetR-like C-terminal domain-containing protein [Dactylosporangium cerinum]